MKKSVTILIPTYNRTLALAATLTSLYYQSYKNFDIIISDQNQQHDISLEPTIKTLTRLFYFGGHKISIFKNLPRKGIAEQRQFLLNHSPSRYSLFLDDDIILEPFVLKNLTKAITKEKCGFVGQALIGLNYFNKSKKEVQKIEFWEEKVKPEKIKLGSAQWNRYQLHNAANILHLQKRLNISPANPKNYKIAWVGGCVLFDTSKLKNCGGFKFWKRVPKIHCGEDVVAQLKVMEKYGGCAQIPSGAYHQELLTTIPDRRTNLPKILQIT